eukprot:TRINITY_DN32519_c0_g1_i1.p1 TRINITY_DN32519_c0_g1~~TRINITY_DN32519_c0_g1_i1.p1  ORF type:complete len:297 (-),score=39.98 TRINITY_DN32519_c0_g1_i1:930-1820(-)
MSGPSSQGGFSRPFSWQGRASSSPSPSATLPPVVQPTANGPVKQEGSQPRSRATPVAEASAIPIARAASAEATFPHVVRTTMIDNISHTRGASVGESGISGDLEEENVVVKIGLLGDQQTGKTSLMVSYLEARRTEDDYVQTLGVTCTEKSHRIGNLTLSMSLWDIGGHRQYRSMLPLVCNDASALIFVFDLTRPSTLMHGVRQWYLQARQLNRSALAVLVGTKYDLFIALPEEGQRSITRQALRYAHAMNAPLVFSSSPFQINVQKVFKLVVARLFDLPCTIPRMTQVGCPIVHY